MPEIAQLIMFKITGKHYYVYFNYHVLMLISVLIRSNSTYPVEAVPTSKCAISVMYTLIMYFMHTIFFLMALCAIALQKLIHICCLYSIETDLNFNTAKSYYMISTPKNYKLYLNKLPVLYTDSIKYLGFTFCSNNCDNNNMLKQICR